MSLYGPRWPLKKGNDDVFEKYDDLKDQISFYLKCLLLTSPGENISDPGYGVGLRRFLFEQITENTVIEIENDIVSTFSRWLPFVQLNDINIDITDQDRNKIKIDLEFNIVNAPNDLQSVGVVLE